MRGGVRQRASPTAILCRLRRKRQRKPTRRREDAEVRRCGKHEPRKDANAYCLLLLPPVSCLLPTACTEAPRPPHRHKLTVQRTAGQGEPSPSRRHAAWPASRTQVMNRQDAKSAKAICDFRFVIWQWLPVRSRYAMCPRSPRCIDAAHDWRTVPPGILLRQGYVAQAAGSTSRAHVHHSPSVPSAANRLKLPRREAS